MEYQLKKQIRQIFRQYMFDNELNQSQLAEKLNINKSIITRIMQEKYNISVDNLEEYCNKLGIGIEIMVKKDKYIAIS